MAASRKLYTEIANVLAGEGALATHMLLADEHSVPGTVRLAQVKSIAWSLADKLAQDNPSFDRQRFYDAVGLGQ